MTQPHPQQEYIITEQLLKDYYEGRLLYNDFLDMCRSRPHTPAAPAERHLIYTVGECMEQCLKARKDERERVLPIFEQCEASLKRAIERSNELCEWCEKLGGTPQNQGQFIALLESTIKDIGSLRGEQP